MMMDAELQVTAQLIERATSPEEVFGTLSGNQADALKSVYRRLSKVVHPDRYTDEEDRARAELAFRALQNLLEQAEEKIKFGIYGDGSTSPKKMPPVLVSTKRHDYVVQGEPFAQGDLCNLYRCTFELDGKETAGTFKVARDPDDNDLAGNEASTLKQLARGTEYAKYAPYIPRLVESFDYQDGRSSAPRRANILTLEPGDYSSLEEIRAHYPQGVDPKDMAWMWRRLLIALGFAHTNAIIHGAVLPAHLLIQPENHGLVLVDWSYAIHAGGSFEAIPALSMAYEQWYPPEVLAKERPQPGTDLYLGAQCMVYLLGGDPITGTMPDAVPRRIQSFLRGTALKGQVQRPQNALVLLDEFTALAESLWGPRKFHEFYMPKK
jgi:serine/threonine protein kinase